MPILRHKGCVLNEYLLKIQIARFVLIVENITHKVKDALSLVYENINIIFQGRASFFLGGGKKF